VVGREGALHPGFLERGVTMTESGNSGPSKRSASTIIGIIASVILLPILIVNLTIIIQSFASPDKVPGFLGYKPLIVLSGSMEPTIFPGDLVIVKETQGSSLKAGDIISYMRGQSVITHRIVEVTEVDGDTRFVTKGDNNNVDDGVLVAFSMLEGKYLMRIPNLGHAAMFMQTPTGMVVFVGIPLGAFGLYEILRRRKEAAKESATARELEKELAAVRQKLAEVQDSDKATSDEETEQKP